MPKGFYTSPIAVNEPIKSYAPNSSEKKELLDTYNNLLNKKIDIPMYIGGKKVITKN